MNEVFLKNKQAFKKILSNYVISNHAMQILDKVNYVVLIGPAAAGRNTIINQLVVTKGYKFVVSDTTRPPKLRDGKLEKDGENYFFRSEEDMLLDLKNGEFLEAELIHDQQVSGTSIRELSAAIKQNKIAINETEYGGAMNVLNAKPDTKVIAILPPTFNVWKKRFENREDISRNEFMNRVQTAQKVIQLIRSDNRIRVVINHEFHKAADEVDNYLHGRPQSQELRQDVGKVLDDFEDNFDKLAQEF